MKRFVRGRQLNDRSREVYEVYHPRDHACYTTAHPHVPLARPQQGDARTREHSSLDYICREKQHKIWKTGAALSAKYVCS